MTRTLLVLLLVAVPVAADVSPRRPPPFWCRVWPSEAPFKTVRGGQNEEQWGTGKGACDRFGWNGAGDWKVFTVKKGVPLAIVAHGDSGCLGHLLFTILEPEGADWKETKSFVGPDWDGEKPDHEPGHRWYHYVPKADKIRVRADKFGFYIAVYVRGRLPFADMDDRIADRDLRKRCVDLAQSLLKESGQIGTGQVLNSLLGMAPICKAQLRGVPGLRDYATNASQSASNRIYAAASELLEALR